MPNPMTNSVNSPKIENPIQSAKQASQDQDQAPALIPGPKPKLDRPPPLCHSSSSILQPRSSPQSGLRLTFPPPLLTKSLLQIYARRLSLTRVPHKLHFAADIVSRRLAGGDERKWTTEFRNHGNKFTSDQKDGMRTVNLIIWEKGVDEWAAEVMVHLRLPLGDAASVSWRFGRRYGSSLGEEGDDWCMFHFQQYFALEISGPDGKNEAGTREIVRIILDESSMSSDDVAESVWRGVKTALGKGYEPSRVKLQRLMQRVKEELGVKGIVVEEVVVTRGFRKVENGHIGNEEKYLPSAFVEIHAEETKPVDGGVRRAAAVIPIDALDDGGLNLMGVIYEGEQPVIHFYRNKYPPRVRVDSRMKK